MKLKLSQIALFAALAVAAVSSHAQQQPGVEIYGQIGMSYTSKNNQTTGNVTTTVLSTNAMSVSHLGFRGREDLGDGMSALFRMESTLSPEVGSAGKANGSILFDRQAYLGLAHTNWGALTLGRQFHAATDRAIRTLDVYQLVPANAHVVPFSLYGVNRYAGNDNRANKAIKYRMDQPNGLQAGLSYAYGDVVGSQSKGSSYSWDLAYVGSNFNVGAGFVSYNGVATLGTTDILPKHQVTSVGGSMAFGAWTPYVAYHSSTLDSATTAGLKTQANKITALGLAWRASPAILLRSAYYMDKGTDLNNVTGRNGNKDTLVVSAEYNFSKRTSVNAILANNSLTAGYMQEVLYTAALGRNPSASSVQFYGVGINHQF